MVPPALLTKLRVLADRLSPKLVSWRRHLHAHPELSFREFETQRFLLETLTALGCTNVKPVAGTGLLVTLEGVNPEQNCIAIRADIDALPIQEVPGRPYGSTKKGVMHACGHDVHSTCALGACAILNETRDSWAGTIKVLFQPGEEVLPGGATKMIAEGVLAHPTVSQIVGLHVAPDLPTGQLGLRSGKYMASADEIYITLFGDGGHAALAHQHTDLIAITAQLIAALQLLVSRKAPPDIPTVLSFGKIESTGGATNVLASEVRLEGTLRTYDEAWRAKAHQLLTDYVTGISNTFGAQIALEIRKGYPALTNDPSSTKRLAEQFSTVFGRDNIAALELRPTAEDFAWYLQEVPGVFFRLGVRNEDEGITAGVHRPDFDVDEASLPLGAFALALSGLRLLVPSEN